MSVGVGGVASLALVTAASAHASLLSGTAQCQSNGTYTVTWTISNDWILADSITDVGHTGGGTLTGLPTTIPASAAKTPPFESVTVLQTGVSGSATSASLTVHGTWTDKVTETNSGSVALPGTCSRGTAATAPTFTNATCSTATGSYTIPSSTVADYFVAIGNGAPVAAPAGTVSEAVGTLIKITAKAKSGGPALTGTTAWSATIAGAGSCGGGGSSSPPPPPPPPPGSNTVTPAVPSITQGVCLSGKESAAFYTIPGITGVTYLNGTTGVAAGNHTVAYGSSTTITAVALTGFAFPSGATTTWTLAANKAATCAAAPTSVLGVTFTQPPPKKPPVAVLPFTGQPILQTTLVAFGLLLAGGLLIGSSRRHRLSQLTWIDRAGK
ncbi:MAG TPA: hypothetical protein VII50_11400 [Acidothermaceae bacterium]